MKRALVLAVLLTPMLFLSSCKSDFEKAQEKYEECIKYQKMKFGKDYKDADGVIPCIKYSPLFMEQNPYLRN
jgi:hypothetical protein